MDNERADAEVVELKRLAEEKLGRTGEEDSPTDAQKARVHIDETQLEIEELAGED